MCRTLPPCHTATLSLASAEFPIHDWQFWIVTIVFVAALAWLLKGVIPIPWLSKRAKAKKQTKRVSITVEGKTPEK
jgi:hypothetical protein